jgi:predicted  nucleic acid-binding Zn-ribbon protein
MLALIALPLGGCGMGKIAECNKFIEAANGAQEAMRKATSKVQASDDPGDIESVAQAMEKAGKDIVAVDVKDEKLRGYQKDYKDMLDKGAKACREMVAAAKTKNLGAMKKAQTDLGAVGPQETKIVGDINGYCTGGK